MHYPPNLFQGLGRITAEGRDADHLAAYLTSLATEWSTTTLTADGPIDEDANPMADAPEPTVRPRMVILSTGAGTVDAELPSAADFPNRVITFKRVGANNGTVTPDGAETIDGGGAVTLSVDFQFVTIISNGTNWLIVGAT